MPNYTSIAMYPVSELPDVYDYSENNELIRQSMINQIWVDQPETPVTDIFRDIDANYKRYVMALAKGKSEKYDGGLWEFNEHGLLSLITNQTVLDCACSHHEIEATTEEFSMALSIFAAAMIAAEEQAPSHIRDYFSYLYHLGHCIKSNAEDTDTFKKEKVNSILD